MFLTETVTLRCDVQGISSHWVYKWYRDGQEIPISGDGDTYTILSAARSHSGQYQCRGELPERAVTSPHSSSLLLTVYETPPKLQISMETHSEDIYTGERLSLTCTVDGDSTGWKYLWYKDTQGAVLSNTDSDRTDGSSYTINSAAPSHSGQYWCRAHRGGFYYNYQKI
ncbi:putative high affinity immunoglobulin gamma Fc receptor IC [Scleropages formosus]|uniref:putative high affinity immunoglobulin gamma Fc receptor IC n=1 Tax=Scleropages formosus TaxID=113540 RepID=UPI0010FAC110|nr:putative high affinity immunoglobulin gamma Fc receptor IC [Scleropages formosus]